MTKWWSGGKTKLAGVDIDTALFDITGNIFAAVLFVDGVKVVGVYSSLVFALPVNKGFHVMVASRRKERTVCRQRYIRCRDLSVVSFDDSNIN